MSGLSASVAPGRPLATVAGRPGQLSTGWTQKSWGSKAGFNLQPPLLTFGSYRANIGSICNPWVSLIPVIPATPLIFVNLKGDGCSSPMKVQGTKIWRENTNIVFRNPVIMNLEPFHQVSGDMSRDSWSSVFKTRIRFLKSWFIPVSETIQWLWLSTMNLLYPPYPIP